MAVTNTLAYFVRFKKSAKNEANLAKYFVNNFFFNEKNIILLTNVFRVRHLSGVPLKGRLLALPTNIKLGWKSLPGTNDLAY
jgi:hypothetical protein